MNTREYNTAVDLYADNIYRFALKHLKNGMSAKDIVQETFLKVWEKHKEINAEKVKSYLFTTAYHTMINWINKEKRYGDFEKVEANLSNPPTAEFDLASILDWALARLPEIQKTVILLRDYEGYSYEEIAEITALSESQVKVYIFRARQAMKSFLKTSELVA